MTALKSMEPVILYYWTDMIELCSEVSHPFKTEIQYKTLRFVQEISMRVLSEKDSTTHAS